MVTHHIAKPARVLKDGPRGHRGLAPTRSALQRTFRKGHDSTTATRTAETVRPAQPEQILPAGLLTGLELCQVPRIIFHLQAYYILGLPVNRIPIYLYSLRETFVYLAVVLDAYSRRVVGWRLGPTLEAELAVGALREALAARRPAPGLVHHSDQGVQYASHAYVELLEEHGAVISMSRRGNPYDNARAESFFKTLKAEEVSLRRYRNLDDAQASLGEFIDEIYNKRRLHSALGYRPPAEFEAALGPASAVARNPRYEFSEA